MRNLEGSEAGTLFTGRTAVASPPLTTFAERTGAGRPELADSVPVSVSDLPTVSMRLDPERTLPMEPVILAQLCAQTQVSERRRILPMGLEYSVHVEFAAESLPQPVVAAAPSVAPAAPHRRAYLLQLLALILGPLLGLSGGAAVAWQLSRQAARPHRTPVDAAPSLPARSTVPRPPLPLQAPPSNAQEATAPTSLPLQSAPPVSSQTSSQPVSSQPVGSHPVSSHPVGSQPVGSQPVGSQPAAARPVSDAPDPVGAPLKRAAGEAAARRMPESAVRAAAAPRPGALYRPLPALANLASGLELDSLSPDPAPPLAPLAMSPALPVGEAPVVSDSESAALPPARSTAASSRQLPPELNPAPRYLSGEQPRLPMLVRQMYHRETVIGTYRLCVNPSGAVTAVTPLVGIPFDDEIQRSLRSWRFAPRTTAVCIAQELHFEVGE